MYEILHGAHSGMRWVALLLLLIAIVNAAGSKNSGDYVKKDTLINLFAMISLHIQLLLGGVLMFTSPKVAYVEGWMSSDTAGGMYRFYGLEHILLMIIAIVIIVIVIIAIPVVIIVLIVRPISRLISCCWRKIDGLRWIRVFCSPIF